MKRFLQIAAMPSLLLLATCCERPKYVTKAMTWECAEDEYKSSFYARPDEYVRFRFVENPHCFEVESSKNFCSELRKNSRTVVNVEFEVWENGHRIIAVDGRPIKDVGGWGHNGANDYSGPCPPKH
jgi:hypothetical protein